MRPLSHCHSHSRETLEEVEASYVGNQTLFVSARCVLNFSPEQARKGKLLHPSPRGSYVENGRSRLSSSFQHSPSSEQPIKNSTQSEAKRWQHCWECHRVIFVILPDDHWPN
eukprot:scaffold24110_cov80-Skeletonema_marinoi.AAC.1